jgi:hypothetical protein
MATKRFPRIASVLATGETISLSAPSKMPSYGWGIPAMLTCPGAKLSIREHGDDAVCNECYATGGFYLMPSVQSQQLARRAWIARSLASDDGAEFVATMVTMIAKSVSKTGEPYFRGHDSGDFYSVAYIGAWQRICEALPHVRFWFPTRSHIVANLLPALQRLASLPNVIVRPSATRLDEPAPIVPGLSAGTSVRRSRTLPIAGQPDCPATTGTPECNAHGCRRCWDEPAVALTYVEH